MTAYEMLSSDWGADVCSSDLFDRTPRSVAATELENFFVQGASQRVPRVVAPRHLKRLQIVRVIPLYGFSRSWSAAIRPESPAFPGASAARCRRAGDGDRKSVV